MDLVLANSADPDEMPNYATFHLGLQRLSKYPFSEKCLKCLMDTRSNIILLYGDILAEKLE